MKLTKKPKIPPPRITTKYSNNYPKASHPKKNILRFLYNFNIKKPQYYRKIVIFRAKKSFVSRETYPKSAKN